MVVWTYTSVITLVMCSMLQQGVMVPSYNSTNMSKASDASPDPTKDGDIDIQNPSDEHSVSSAGSVVVPSYNSTNDSQIADVSLKSVTERETVSSKSSAEHTPTKVPKLSEKDRGSDINNSSAEQNLSSTPTTEVRVAPEKMESKERTSSDLLKFVGDTDLAKHTLTTKVPVVPEHSESDIHNSSAEQHLSSDPPTEFEGIDRPGEMKTKEPTFGNVLKVVGDADHGSKTESLQIPEVNDYLDKVESSAPNLKEVLRRVSHQSPFLVEDQDGRNALFVYIRFISKNIIPDVARITDILEKRVSRVIALEDLTEDQELVELLHKELPTVGEVLKTLGDGIPHADHLNLIGVEDLQELSHVASDVIDKEINVSNHMHFQGAQEEAEENVDVLDSSLFTALKTGIMDKIHTETLLKPKPVDEYTAIDLSYMYDEEVKNTSYLDTLFNQEQMSSTTPLQLFHKGMNLLFRIKGYALTQMKT